MDENMKLRLCPFCGGSAKLMVCDGADYYHSNIGTAILHGRLLDHFLVKCEKCGVKTKAYLTEKGVYKSWNRRLNDEHER